MNSPICHHCGLTIRDGWGWWFNDGETRISTPFCRGCAEALLWHGELVLPEIPKEMVN